jgi:hypothetical protein
MTREGDGLTPFGVGPLRGCDHGDRLKGEAMSSPDHKNNDLAASLPWNWRQHRSHDNLLGIDAEPVMIFTGEGNAA